MKNNLKILSLNKKELVQIYLYFNPTHIDFLLHIFWSKEIMFHDEYGINIRYKYEI